MRNIIFLTALICAVVLAPAIGFSANTPEPAMPDFRASAFEGGLSAEASVERDERTNMETVVRITTGAVGGGQS